MYSKETSGKLRRTAYEVKRYRTLSRTLPVIIGFLASMLIITYVVTILYNKYGSFTVTVNKFDSIKYSLQLSESPDFYGATTRLNSKASKDITNISVNDLPYNLDDINGEHNGNNYVAYTFYCRNSGENFITYEYDLYITNMSLGIQNAVRIRLYVNGEYTDYAFPAASGGAEPGTTMFLSTKDVVIKQVPNFGSGAMTKFTVVIWLEGDDPECIDNILGGEFKVDMSMTVIDVGDVDPDPQHPEDISAGGDTRGQDGDNSDTDITDEVLGGDWIAIPIVVFFLAMFGFLGYKLFRRNDLTYIPETKPKKQPKPKKQSKKTDAQSTSTAPADASAASATQEATNTDIDSSAQQEGAPTDKGDEI